MPQIIIRGIELEIVKTMSIDLLMGLHRIIGCPLDDLTLECNTSTFVKNGALDKGYPFVEVAWFDRGQTVQDQVAKEITAHIQRAGYSNIDIMFTTLEKIKYYENGQHFG
ncbi:DUF1904 domain-containing protein [Desulfotomaculum defluvii]